MSAQKQDTCNFTVRSDESDYELNESDTKTASPRIVGFYIEEQRNNAVMPNTSSNANGGRPQSRFNPGYGLAEWNRIRKRERNKRNRERKKQKRKMLLLHPGSIYPSTSELYNDQRLYNHESDENEPVSVLKTEEIIKPFSDEDMRRNGFDVPHIDEDEYTNPFSDYDGYRTESSPNDANSSETVRNFAGYFVPVRKESENFSAPMVKRIENTSLSNSRSCSTSVSSCSMSMDETTSSSDAQVAFTSKKVSGMNMPTASVSEAAIDINTPVSPVSENLEEGINDENMLASPMSESSDDTDGTQITMNFSPISKSSEEEKVDDRIVTINDPSMYQGLVDRLLLNRESSRETNAFHSRENQINIETDNATEYTSGWPRTNGQDIASLLQKTGLFLGSGQPHHDSDADYELFSGSILNRNGFVNRRDTPLSDVPQNRMNLGLNARSSNTIYDHGVSKKVIKAEYRQWEWVHASSEFSSKENSNEKYPMVKEMVEEEGISSSDLHDDDLMSGSSISSSEEDLCAGSEQGNEPIRYVQQEHHAGASDSFDSEDISASDSNFSSVEDEQNKQVEPYPDLHASSSNSELIDFSSFLTQPRSDEITDLREQRDPLHSESFFSSQKNEQKLENDASSRSAHTINMDNTSMLTGFTTASKKQIYVSEDAIKKMAKRLDQDSERAAEDNAVGVSMDVFDEENIFNDVRMRENTQVKVSVVTEDCVFSDGEPFNKSREENENSKRTRLDDTVDKESAIRNDRLHTTDAKAEDTRNGRDLNEKQLKNRSDTGKQIMKEIDARISAINRMEEEVLEAGDETNKNRSLSRIGGQSDIRNSKFCVDGAQKENEPVVGTNAKDKNKQDRVIKHVSKDESKVKIDDIVPINNDIITKNAPMRMYGKPVKGHTTLEIQKNRKIEEIYAKVAKKYKNQRKEWVDVQFKWAYLSCFKSNTLEKDIADRMEKRRISEYSILRRIVEGDDVCFKLMCLMIVRTGSMLELYDGFYSLLFRADKAIQGRVVAQKLKIGDKVYVFNAELLTHEKDILAIDGPAFQMHSNSVMRVQDDKKLGYTKCASFLIKFTNVDKTGGLVPAIEFSIIRIVEDKVLIQCQGLKRAVDMNKLEEEMEYMKVLAVKHGIKEEFKLKRYCKLLVKDLHSCREGIFTWWNIREEIRIGDKIRAISTAIVNDTVGLHFNTINRSYVSKM